MEIKIRQIQGKEASVLVIPVKRRKVETWAGPRKLFLSPSVDFWEAKLWSVWEMNSPHSVCTWLHVNSVPSSNAPNLAIFDYMDGEHFL